MNIWTKARGYIQLYKIIYGTYYDFWFRVSVVDQ